MRTRLTMTKWAPLTMTKRTRLTMTKRNRLTMAKRIRLTMAKRTRLTMTKRTRLTMTKRTRLTMAKRARLTMTNRARLTTVQSLTPLLRTWLGAASLSAVVGEGAIVTTVQTETELSEDSHWWRRAASGPAAPTLAAAPEILLLAGGRLGAEAAVPGLQRRALAGPGQVFIAPTGGQLPLSLAGVTGHEPPAHLQGVDPGHAEASVAAGPARHAALPSVQHPSLQVLHAAVVQLPTLPLIINQVVLFTYRSNPR